MIFSNEYFLNSSKCSRKPSKKRKPGEPKTGEPKPADEILKIPEHGPGVWCMLPLLAKLPGVVQERIIKIAGQIMEKMNFFNVYRYEEEEDESDSDDDNSDEEDSDDEDESENKANR